MSRKLGPVAAAALGLALLAGCGSEGPVVGGVAAEVEDRTVTLDEVDTLTDALCQTWEAGESYRNTNARSAIQRELVTRLVETAVVDEVGLGEYVDPDVRRSQIPGWDDLSEDEQDALWEFLESESRRSAALQELAGDAASEEEAQANVEAELGRMIDEEGVDITINPRYGIEVEDGVIGESEQLSVAVSDFASGEVDLDRLRELPDSQVCGPLPPASGPLGG